MQFVHNVYFTLNDDSNEAQDRLVAECQKYLTDHPGTIHFAVGKRQEASQRDVNDQDFQVALNIVFADQAAHDAYQIAPRHQQFVDDNRENWKTVRVFDAELVPVVPQSDS